MKIKYYFCFKEDKRSSMDMLGNFISNGQKKYKKNLVKSIIPKTFTPNWINKYNFIMRFERFVNYPIQAYFAKKSDIAHIIDHSYSHLVSFLNAKKNGHQIENGKMMFIYQAQQAFSVWHKILPEINDETIKLLEK